MRAISTAKPDVQAHWHVEIQTNIYSLCHLANLSSHDQPSMPWRSKIKLGCKSSSVCLYVHIYIYSLGPTYRVPVCMYIVCYSLFRIPPMCGRKTWNYHWNRCTHIFMLGEALNLAHEFLIYAIFGNILTPWYSTQPSGQGIFLIHSTPFGFQRVTHH